VPSAGTPTEIIAALNNALVYDDILHRLAADGTKTLPGWPEAYENAHEKAKWYAVIKQPVVKAQ
jgi:hypothetical protein